MYPTICVSAIGLREIGFAALFESVIAETDKLENGCPRLSLVGGTNIPERNQFGMGIARQSDAAAGNELSLDTKKNIGDCFLHLADLPTFALDRLSRYEHLLWRQARQIVVTLKSLQHYRRPPRPSPFHSRPAAAIPMNSSDGSRESILQNPKRPVILTEGGYLVDGEKLCPLPAIWKRKVPRCCPDTAERLPTRKLRGVLRQKYDCGATEPVIAQLLGIGCMAGANQLPTRKERPQGRSHKS